MFRDKLEKADEVFKMPKEYQDLLLRVLTIQADCEIGGPHLYVREWLLDAPSPDDQWRLTRIAAEEMDHFRKFARLLRDLGVDATPLAYKNKPERLVEIFRQDMPTWADVAAFSALADRVGKYMLEEFVDCSYVPLSNILPRILVEEKGHIQFGEMKLEQMAQDPDTKRQAQETVDRWYPRALDMFGSSRSRRSEQYLEWGLKRRTNEEARRQFIGEVNPVLERLGYQVPALDHDRHYA